MKHLANVQKNCNTKILIVMFMAILSCKCFSQINIIYIEGKVIERPRPMSAGFTTLKIQTEKEAYLLLDYPKWDDTALNDEIKCWVAKGPVDSSYGERMWFWISELNPTEKDKREAKEKAKKYRNIDLKI